MTSAADASTLVRRNLSVLHIPAADFQFVNFWRVRDVGNMAVVSISSTHG